MKKTFKNLVLGALAALLCCVVGVAAGCESINNTFGALGDHFDNLVGEMTHECTFDVLNSGANGHWYECKCGAVSEMGIQAHAGGKATCVEQAVCVICDAKYGTLTEHKGGEATCSEPAKCEVCGKGYGILGEHSYTELKADASKHWYECKCGVVADGTDVAHFGGESTCTELAKCELCGTEYGVLKAHEYTELKVSETEHWYECVCGDKKDVTAHFGGEATCTAKAVCEACGEAYGELKAHNYSSDLTVGDTTHWYECFDCGDKKDEVAHSYTRYEHDAATHWGICVCGKNSPVETHLSDEPASCTQAAVCKVCGTAFGGTAEHVHNAYAHDANGHWSVCGCGAKVEGSDASHELVWKLNENNTEHWQECVCGYKTNEGAHTVGTAATCTEKAICGACGEEYGEALGHTEEVLPAVDATCTTDGKTEGLHCPTCGEVFVAQETIAAFGHTYKITYTAEGVADKEKHWKECTVCGAKEENSEAAHVYEGSECECGYIISDADVVDKLYALAKNETLAGTYLLTGVITKAEAFSTQYNNVTITITVEGKEDKPVVCYRLKGDDADLLMVGDTVSVLGQLTNYKGTFEFNSGCIIDSCELVDEAASKMNAAKNALTLSADELNAVGAFVALPATSSYSATIAWSLKEASEYASIADGKLTVGKMPVGSAQLTVVATITIGENTGTKEFTVAVKDPYVVPAADSTLTIPEAIELAKRQDHNTFTTDKYYLIVTIIDVYSTSWGNMNVQDADGNKFVIYGLYSEDGSVQYNAMTTQPLAGDTIKVYGGIGRYNSTYQMKNGWLIEHTLSDANKLTADKNALTIETAFDAAATVDLPTTGANGSAIAWAWAEAPDAAVAKLEDGKLVIAAPTADATLTLNATLTLGDETLTKEFTIVITVAGQGGDETVDPLLPKENVAYYFVTTAETPETIYVSSVESKYLKTGGSMHAVTFTFVKVAGQTNQYYIKTSTDKYVNVNTASKSNELIYTEDVAEAYAWIFDTETKTIQCSVNTTADEALYLRYNKSSMRISRYRSGQVAVWFAEYVEPTVAEKVAAEKAALTLEKTEFSAVNDTLTLSATGSVYGLAIAWTMEASDYAKLENNVFTVTALPTDADATATLKATITSGEETDSVEFVVTIKQEVVTPPESGEVEAVSPSVFTISENPWGLVNEGKMAEGTTLAIGPVSIKFSATGTGVKLWNNDHLRFYGENSMTFSIDEQYKITSVTIEFYNTSASNIMKDSTTEQGGATFINLAQKEGVGTQTVTLTPVDGTAELVVSRVNTSGHWRIKSFSVSFEKVA